jgi:hypothetical protein
VEVHGGDVVVVMWNSMVVVRRHDGNNGVETETLSGFAS